MSCNESLSERDSVRESMPFTQGLIVSPLRVASGRGMKMLMMCKNDSKKYVSPPTLMSLDKCVKLIGNSKVGLLLIFMFINKVQAVIHLIK